MSVTDIGATIANASRLGSNVGIFVQAAENRAALALLELQQTSGNLRRVALGAVIAGAAFMLAGGSLSLVVAAAFWDTPYRVAALVVLVALHLAVAGAMTWFSVTGWRRVQFFTDLREQLTKDCACLREVLKSGDSN